MTYAGISILLLLGALALFFLVVCLIGFLLGLPIAWFIDWSNTPTQQPIQDESQATSLYVPAPSAQPSRTNPFTEVSDAYLDNLERVLGDKS